MTKEQAIDIIVNLEIDCTLDKYDIQEKIEDNNLSNEIKLHSGSSKICMDFLKADFVIKWSKGLSYNENEDENEALRETYMYEKAKKENLEMFFPYTESLGQINNTYFVLQNKIDFSAEDIEGKKRSKYENISKTASLRMINKMEKGFIIKGCWYNRSLDSLWASMALVLYGKKFCKKLCKFIQENKINDLHSSNIGYKDDKPVILDFSGYFR